MPKFSNTHAERMLAISWPSPEDIDLLFRAVHFVAMRKEKLDQPLPSATVSDGNTGRSGISSEIRNNENIDSTNKPENSNERTEPIKSPDGESLESTKSSDMTLLTTPFQRFRGRYLIVTDFTSQLWCEQQLHYNFDPPPGVVIKEKPQMAKGSDLHLARELEIQDIVEVEVTCKEDAFALKLLNLISCVHDFSMGGHLVRREIPIFGSPFNLELFVVGVIDEVRIDDASGKAEIVELKTRLTPRLPSRAQKKTHNLQVMLYRRMWNDLCEGQLSKEDIIKYMKLSPDRCLGDGICEELRNLGLIPKFGSITLDALLDRFRAKMSSLPTADQLSVEYCHQETKECFAVETVGYDEPWLRQQLEQSSLYWKGERGPRGVEIEEAWKCRFCDFADVCAWRIKKHEECAARNRQNFLQNPSSIVQPSSDK